MPNPVLGVFFHWLGGLASGRFYVPCRGVRFWSWETYWLAGGFFSWILAPWILAGFMTRDLTAVLSEAPADTLMWCYIFGAMWGAGGLTFGLTMRYLEKKEAIKEFDMKKGILVATFSGVMSASMSYGLAAGDAIKAITLSHGTETLWQGLPVLVIVLFGGFTTNFIWCLILNIRNKTGHEYISPSLKSAKRGAVSVPMLANYPFCALAGATWHMQFFSTRWAKRRWEPTSSPVGPSTWPALSSSRPSGALA